MMFWRIVVVIVLILFVGVGMVVGQTDAPPLVLPKFVRSLSPSGFEAWALWQNQMAETHLQKGWEPRYIEGSATRATFDTQMNGPRGRRGSFNFNGLMVSESFSTSYVNNNYSGPGPLTILNPYCRNMESGNPDWSKLYVIVNGKVMTMTQAIGKYGPKAPEQLYTELMAPYFQMIMPAQRLGICDQ